MDELTESEMEMGLEMPNCLECAHYYITHEASFPYGCRGMNFKSRRLPQLDVIEISEAYCLVFQPKPVY